MSFFSFVLDAVHDFFLDDDQNHVGSTAYVNDRVTPRDTRKYSWRPQLPDARDHVFEPPIPTAAALPVHVDLTPTCPPIYDQGPYGSCTGQGACRVLQFSARKQGLPSGNVVPSRLFAYYNGRLAEGTQDQDAGAYIRDVIKGVNKFGCPAEERWTYVAKKVTKKPKPPVYAEAALHPAVKYAAVKQDLQTLRATLASGFPVVYGITVYESFESAAVAKTGVVPMPGKNEQNLGGHCTVLVGYDDASQRFIGHNSWGTGWGNAGMYTIPYAYVTNPGLASDFWVIQLVK